MAFASVTYTSASGTTFALTNSSGDPIPYLRQADISVTVNGVLQVQGTDYTFNTAGTSIILSSSVSGATVIISRTTDISDATVVYTAGSTLTAQDLNNADNQIRYGLQEFSDTYAALTTGTGDLEDFGGFIGSSEVWVSDNAHAATTGAIDNRVDNKIDTALTTDVVAGDSITVTDNTPSAGQITIGVTNASITTAKLVDGSVTSAKIADGTIVAADLASNSVTTAKILDANVTTAKILDGAVTSDKIADGTIVNADVSASAEIAVSKLADGSARQLLQTDAAGTGVEWTDNVDIPGTLDVTGAVTLDSTLTIPSGSASVPSINFSADTDTGIYYSTGLFTGTGIAIATGGTERVKVTMNGRVYFETNLLGNNGGLVVRNGSSSTNPALLIGPVGGVGSPPTPPGIEINGIVADLSSNTSYLSLNSSSLRFNINGTDVGRIDGSGRFLINDTLDSGGALLQIDGDRIRLSTAKTPASASDTGTTGEVCWDANYIYVCTATNTWKRAALSTW